MRERLTLLGYTEDCGKIVIRFGRDNSCLCSMIMTNDIDRGVAVVTVSAVWLTWAVAGHCVCFFFYLLLLPLSHYDVPQQGLLGELVLIQQQIQRHEEEVRRAAAASSARSPPPEPAPSPAEMKRKVKVPSHIDLSSPTNGFLIETASV